MVASRKKLPACDPSKMPPILVLKVVGWKEGQRRQVPVLGLRFCNLGLPPSPGDGLSDRHHLQIQIQEPGVEGLLLRQTALWASRNQTEFRWKEGALPALPAAVSSLTAKEVSANGCYFGLNGAESAAGAIELC